MININNLYYLVKLTLPGAAALCEVPNSNLAAFLSSSLVGVFLTFSQFPNFLLLWFFCFLPYSSSRAVLAPNFQLLSAYASLYCII